MPYPRSPLVLVKEIILKKKKKIPRKVELEIWGERKKKLKIQQQLDVRGYKNTLFDKVDFSFIVR